MYMKGMIVWINFKIGNDYFGKKKVNSNLNMKS